MVEPTTGDTISFEGMTPILPVRDLIASLEHYRDVLGFTVDWFQTGIIGSVSRGRCKVFLCEGDQGHPGTWVFIEVNDAEALFRDYTAKGATIRIPPTNYAWALEMQVLDPDGNVLRFGSEPLEGQPIGDWLDMRGTRWRNLGGARWARVEDHS